MSISPPTTWIGAEERSEQAIRRCETSMLGFGKYHDWAYEQILTNKPNYVTYIFQESIAGSEEQHRFQERATLKTHESEKGMKEEWEDQNPEKPMKG